jgi:hypothetical protein
MAMSIGEELKKKMKRHSKISWEVLKFPDTEETKGEETMKKNLSGAPHTGG